LILKTYFGAVVHYLWKNFYTHFMKPTYNIQSEEFLELHQKIDKQCCSLKHNLDKQCCSLKHNLDQRINQFLVEYSDTCFPSLADILNYLSTRKGKIIVLGARPAMGKTSLMLSIIAADVSVNHLVISTELSATQILEKYKNSIGSNIELKILDEFNIEQDAKSHYFMSIGNLYTIDLRKISVENIRKILIWHQAHVPVQYVFIDFYQLISYSPDNLKLLKALIVEYNVTLIILSQLERIVNEKPMEPPPISSYNGLTYSSYIDEYYYLVRPVYYNLSVSESGNNLSNLAIIHCLKGDLINQQVIVKFDDGIFNKAKPSDMITV